MKKILLTGGSGFIGRNIQESYLSEKYQIVAPTSSELNLVDDESVARFFRSAEFDVVIHSACKPGHRNASDLIGLFYSNCRMFFNLIHNSKSFGKLINIGSGAVYDMRYYQPKMTEDFAGKFIPVDEHGFCKYVINREVARLDNVIDLRVFGIFGKYEDYAIRFISNAICKAIHGLPITIKQNRKFDYIYVDDLTQILEFFIDAKQTLHKAYNATPDESVKLLEIAKIVKDVAARDVPIKILSDGLGLEYSGDNSRLKSEMKNLKVTNLYNSIQDLYLWYSKNQSLIDREKLLTDK